MAAPYRSLIAALGLLLACPADARTPPAGFAPFPCPRPSAGWTVTWPGPIYSASYDNDSQQLYVVLQQAIPAQPSTLTTVLAIEGNGPPGGVLSVEDRIPNTLLALDDKFGTAPPRNFRAVQAFINVPYGVMQSLSTTANPQQVYQNTVLSYRMVLLTEKDNCILQWEFGASPYGPIITR